MRPASAALDGISALDASGEGIATGMTDSEGKTSFSLYGDLPGMTALTLAATGTSLSKELAIRTTSDAAQPVRPTGQPSERTRSMRWLQKRTA